MRAFEYLIVEKRNIIPISTEYNTQEQRDYLNKLGEEGFEIAYFDENFFIFKKEIQIIPQQLTGKLHD